MSSGGASGNGQGWKARRHNGASTLTCQGWRTTSSSLWSSPNTSSQEKASRKLGVQRGACTGAARRAGGRLHRGAALAGAGRARGVAGDTRIGRGLWLWAAVQFSALSPRTALIEGKLFLIHVTVKQDYFYPTTRVWSMGKIAASHMCVRGGTEPTSWRLRLFEVETCIPRLSRYTHSFCLPTPTTRIPHSPPICACVEGHWAPGWGAQTTRIQCTSKPCFAAPLVLRPPHFVAMRVRPGQPRVEAKRRPNRGARFFQLGFSQGPHDVR